MVDGSRLVSVVGVVHSNHGDLNDSGGKSRFLMPAGYYPIIYVRGFAATPGELNEAADDPFSGFNLGSTVHRPDTKTAWPEPVAFEGPLVRLIDDYGYIDAIERGKHNQLPTSSDREIDPFKTIWIFRYYDNLSTRFPNRSSTRDEMVELGKKLYDFVGEVRKKTGSAKVHLVAHSMGGLVCRCLIQKIYAERRRLGTAQEIAERNVGEIARLFTYATPHNGIESQYAALAVLGNFFTGTGMLGTDVFRHDVMKTYLSDRIADDFAPNRLTGLPLEDAFCLVGTNAADYPVAGTLSRRVIGPHSDGLVLIRNASLRGVGRIYLHRSHSGPFGIVNSEEAYRHLANFLFGGVMILELKPDGDPVDSDDEDLSLHADVTVARGDGAEICNDASRTKFCPVRLGAGFLRNEPTILLTLPVPDFSRSSPLTVKVALGFYALPESVNSTAVTLLPDWSGVLTISVKNRQETTMVWQTPRQKPDITREIRLPDSFQLLRTKLKIALRWQERNDAEPLGARTPRPLNLGGGGMDFPVALGV